MVGLIVSDTREKANEHILKYFDKHGIEYRVAKIDIGDYMCEENQTIRVERKKNLNELAMNMCSPDRMRFYAECRRAHDAGVRLIVLCEQGGGIKTFDDVRSWKNKYGKVTGRMLQDAIFNLQMAYGIPVLFCDKRSTGRRIVEILTGVWEKDDGRQGK